MRKPAPTRSIPILVIANPAKYSVFYRPYDSYKIKLVRKVMVKVLKVKLVDEELFTRSRDRHQRGAPAALTFIHFSGQGSDTTYNTHLRVWCVYVYR